MTKKIKQKNDDNGQPQLFDGATFGDRYATAGGKQAIYCNRIKDTHFLMVQDTGKLMPYNSDGTVSSKKEQDDPDCLLTITASIKPEIGHLIYTPGKKPRWLAGETLTGYTIYNGKESEHCFGTVTDVRFDNEENDWLYIFSNNIYLTEGYLVLIDTFSESL